MFLKQNKKCALSGVLLSFNTIAKNQTSKKTASLDRIDSSKGYIEGNVQWVHKKINDLKSNFDEDTLIKMCNLISKNKPIEISDIDRVIF